MTTQTRKQIAIQQLDWLEKQYGQLAVREYGSFASRSMNLPSASLIVELFGSFAQAMACVVQRRREIVMAKERLQAERDRLEVELLCEFLLRKRGEDDFAAPMAKVL